MHFAVTLSATACGDRILAWWLLFSLEFHLGVRYTLNEEFCKPAAWQSFSALSLIDCLDFFAFSLARKVKKEGAFSAFITLPESATVLSIVHPNFISKTFVCHNMWDSLVSFVLSPRCLQFVRYGTVEIVITNVCETTESEKNPPRLQHSCRSWKKSNVKYVLF